MASFLSHLGVVLRQLSPHSASPFLSLIWYADMEHDSGRTVSATSEPRIVWLRRQSIDPSLFPQLVTLKAQS